MHADLIIHHAKIYTVDPQLPWAEAVAVHNGRFLAVGANDDILNLAGPQTRVIDGNGRLLLPGLIDSHVHFLDTAVRRQQLSLFGVADFDDALRRIAAAAATKKPGEWLLGYGWDEVNWPTLPTAAHLDAAAPHNPVALARLDMHTYWVNQAALDIAGITAETPDPPESKIERDENGRPSGILREWNALQLLLPHIPQPDMAAKESWLRETIAAAHRLGLTGVHDQRVEKEGQESFRLWQTLQRRGALPLRVHMNVAADFLPEAAALGLQSGFGNDHLWVGHLKTFADGTMGSRTAAMLDPFTGMPDNLGVIVTPADELWRIATDAADAGFALSIHAIGDRAVREVLDVLIERESLDSGHKLPMPHRIEHVQLIHPDDLARVGGQRIMAAVQPVHIQTDWQTADRVWSSRSRYAYAFRSLLDRGLKLALGSDAPVASMNPFVGMFAAIKRQDESGQPAGGWYPEERLTLAEAIYGYTMGPALMSGKEAHQGSISPGKWADMALLADDLFALPVEKMPETAVDMTLVAGEIVYRRE
ncbi:MAG: amidohydrolase [Chloroflexota bacterium]